MLRIQPIRNPNETARLLEAFDPRSTTWIVSDLKSKIDLNRRLLRETEFLPSSAVMRASELWKALITRTRADLQIVSREFALTFIADRLSSSEWSWAHSPGVPQTVFDYMTQLMPVISHPSGEELMADWFSRNEASRTRWGRWLTASIYVWQLMLREGFVAAPWASGVLVNEPTLSDVWSRPLVIDLGADLTQVEADLLLVLGDHLDILVLKPMPAWRAEFARTLQAYDVLEAKVGLRHEPPLEQTSDDQSAATRSARVSYRKYTTMIAEVKDATAQVRQWLDEGQLKPSEIAIVAPDIEPYWFALSNYLEIEGIPCQKDRVRRLHSFADMAQWLANLRLRLGGYDEADLELAIYTGLDFSNKLISFDKFKILYSAVYSREDFSRHASVSRAFAIDLSPLSSALRDDFLMWSLKQLPATVDIDRVEQGLRRVLSECPESLLLPVKRWLVYLEHVLSRIEIRIQVGDPEGIACVRLSSAESSPATRMILIGFTESALKKTVPTSILFSDLRSLAQDSGFHLASEDQAQAEFETRWLIEAGHRSLILSVPETDFDGVPQAPSWIWVKGSREQNDGRLVTVPLETRWDEIQKAGLESISEERRWISSKKARVERSLRQDFNESPIENFAAGLVDSLSPSKIEAYLECPFIFAAKHLFRLADRSELDLEVDPMSRGSLMHAVFEELTSEPVRFNLSEDELDAIVEKARQTSELKLADDRLWQPLKARHIDLGRRFLEFEKTYRQEFGLVKTVAREFAIDGYLEPASGRLTTVKSEGALKFNGRIDRIDSDDSGHLAVFDYKSSSFGLSQFGSWIKNNKVQLLLYSLAIENGLTDLAARPIFAALYYVARPLTRDTGFMIEGSEQNLYAIKNKRKQNRMSLEQKDSFFRDGEALIQRAASGILAGQFGPNPRDPAICKECRWSSLCRTPHLNS